MRKISFLMLAGLVLFWSVVPLCQGKEPRDYTLKELNAYWARLIAVGKKVSVKDLESGMPDATLEQWVAGMAIKESEIEWEVNDCGETGNGENTPSCVEVSFTGSDSRRYSISIIFGVCNPEQKSFNNPDVWSIWDGYLYKEISSLADLRKKITEPRPTSEVDKSDNGHGQLHGALFTNNFELFKKLIENGADVNSSSGYNGSILCQAVGENKMEFIDLLLSKGADVQKAASCAKDLKMLEYLVSKGADISSKSGAGNKLLAQAVCSSKLDMCRYLVSKGVDVSEKGSGGYTPLHYARTKEIAELLVANGADVNAKDDHGRTPLLDATRHNLPLCEFLVSKGADVNVKIDNGITPLYNAVSAGKLDIAKFLIEKGADVNEPGHEGKTPYDIAKEYDILDMRVYLLSVGAKGEPPGEFEKLKKENAWILSIWDHRSKGCAYAQQKDYDNAIVEQTAIINLDPDNGTAYYDRAWAFIAKYEYDKAVADSLKAIKLAPEFILPDVYYNLGVVRKYRHEYKYAIADFTKAIELDPKNVNAYHLRADVYTIKGLYDKALADYAKVIEMKPGKVGMAYYNGKVCLYKGDRKGAISCFEKAFDIMEKKINDKSSGGDYASIASYALLIPKLEEAEKYARKGLEVDPSYVWLHNDLGDVYLLQDKMEEAIKEYWTFVAEFDEPNPKERLNEHFSLLEKRYPEKTVLINETQKALGID